jgi:hypothetical protein
VLDVSLSRERLCLAIVEHHLTFARIGLIVGSTDSLDAVDAFAPVLPHHPATAGSALPVAEVQAWIEGSVIRLSACLQFFPRCPRLELCIPNRSCHRIPECYRLAVCVQLVSNIRAWTMLDKDGQE